MVVPREDFQAAIEHALESMPSDRYIAPEHAERLRKVGREATVVSDNFRPLPGCPVRQAGLTVPCSDPIQTLTEELFEFACRFDRALKRRGYAPFDVYRVVDV